MGLNKLHNPQMTTTFIPLWGDNKIIDKKSLILDPIIRILIPQTNFKFMKCGDDSLFQYLNYLNLINMNLILV